MVFLSGSNRVDSSDQFLYWCSIRMCPSFCSTDDGITPDYVQSSASQVCMSSNPLHFYYTHIHFTNWRASLRCGVKRVSFVNQPPAVTLKTES